MQEGLFSFIKNEYKIYPKVEKKVEKKKDKLEDIKETHTETFCNRVDENSNKIILYKLKEPSEKVTSLFQELKAEIQELEEEMIKWQNEIKNDLEEESHVNIPMGTILDLA